MKITAVIDFVLEKIPILRYLFSKNWFQDQEKI